MRSAFVAPFLLAWLPACSGMPDGGQHMSLEAPAVDTDALVAVAKGEIAAEPDMYRTVWGSPIDYDRYVVRTNGLGGAIGVVWFEERNPLGRPSGVAVRVDPGTGLTEPVRLE